MQVAIVGGGIGGLATAIALQRVGIQAAVFEQAPEIRAVGAGISLWSNAMHALGRLGVADQVASHGAVFRRGLAISARGDLISTLDLAEFEETAPNVLVHRADLQQVLLEAAGVASVSVGHRCVAVEPAADKTRLAFENGASYVADVVVGADGVRSVVRETLFGPPRLRYSGVTAWRGVVECDPPQLEPQTTALFLGRGCKVGIFRCGKGRVYWFVAALAPEGGRDGPSGPRRSLLDRLQEWPTLATSVIEATADAQILRNDLSDCAPATRWGKGRVTLLGDAIHSTTPNLGQGACQAIESAVHLAHVLSGANDLEAALRRYEQERRRRTAMVTRESRRGGRIMYVRHPWLAWLRDSLLRSAFAQSRMRKLYRELLTYETPELNPSSDPETIR